MISIRLARPGDWPMIELFHQEQNGRQGTNTSLPTLFRDNGDFSENIALAFVVERDEVPVSSFYFELVPEVCFAGCDPQATAFARRQINQIAFGLRCLGYTGINCKVPQHMAESIASPLEKAGFNKDEDLVHFFKDLRLPAVADEGGDR